MCSPVLLLGAPASAGFFPTLIGGAGMGTVLGAAPAAATAGLFGAGGGFSFGQTFNTIRQGANLVGSAVRAVGADYNSQVQAANYRYQAENMEYQRKVAENNALMAERAAEYEADTFDLNKRRLLATQRSSFGKSNVVINQDTPLQITTETAAESELERMAILYKGQTQSQAYIQQGVGQVAAAARYRANAQMAEKSGKISAITELGSGLYTTSQYTGFGSSLLTGTS